MTKYKSIFDALAAPFGARGEVKTRNQGGRPVSYITARTVMNRLDVVVGPENWWDDYQPLEKSVICRITIRLPDGQLLTKCDAGGYAGMADPGDDDKSGYSDAFKRTAVKFGVARYLYNDGVATLASSSPATSSAETPTEQAPSAQLSAGTLPAPAEAPKEPRITTGYQLYQWADKCRIDTRLTAWIVSTFSQYPAKITGWSQAQVAAALPKIREHLEQIKREAA